MKSDLTYIHCHLPAVDALYQVKSAIRSIDPEANPAIDVDDWSLTWVSKELSAPMKISALEQANGTHIYATICDHEDTAGWDAIRAQFTQLANDTHGSSENAGPTNALECLHDMMADPTWSANIDVLRSALDSAANSPYNRIGRLTDALQALACYAYLRRSTSGMTPREIATKVGLANVYRERISRHTANKYGNEYKFNYKGGRVLMQEHLTLGGGSNDEQCLSIHFLWDGARGRMVIGHIGRHLTNTISHT